MYFSIEQMRSESGTTVCVARMYMIVSYMMDWRLKDKYRILRFLFYN